MFGKKKKVGETNIVEIPEESASVYKRLRSRGYLLLHPELEKKAILLDFARALVRTAAFCIIATWLFSEVVTFAYMYSIYGIVR